MIQNITAGAVMFLYSNYHQKKKWQFMNESEKNKILKPNSKKPPLEAVFLI